MSDLISREALLKALKKSRKYHAQNGRELELLCRCENIVNEQPTVEVVPVVHCKDCKQWGCGLPMETDSVKCCGVGGYMVGKNGYCVYGERKA